MTYQYDFLIIGAGLAGMSYALKIAQAHKGKICIVCKTALHEADTLPDIEQSAAMAGMNQQQAAHHIQHTLQTGEGICNEKVVQNVIQTAPRLLQQWQQWTATEQTDKTNETTIWQRMAEAVHSHPHIDIKENHFAVELITQHHLGIEVTRRTADIVCYGAYVLNPATKKVDTYLSKLTMVCTGGCGAVYQSTTNVTAATGDGVAMVYRAKGTVQNMEFVQFHPTTLYSQAETHPAYPIDNMLRHAGATLCLPNGNTFMQNHDKRGSKAPSDIIAQAIDKELKRHGINHVCMDATQIPEVDIHRHFEALYQKCMSMGIDMTKDLIPVRPAHHYMCGGIRTDRHGESSIQRLYAIGECTYTGLHGANCLPNNTFYETLYYADTAAKHGLQQVAQHQINTDVPEWNDNGTMTNEEHVLITQSAKEVGEVMTNYVGIVRSDLRLKRAWDRLDLLYEETEALFKRVKADREICELRNMINVGYLITRQAMERKECRGLHYTLDYPWHAYD